MKYRLVEENELRRLIESDMIYDELCAQGVENWIGCDFVHFPDIDEIEKKINKYKGYIEIYPFAENVVKTLPLAVDVKKKRRGRQEIKVNG